MHIIHRNQYGYAHKIVHNTPLLQKGLTPLSTDKHNLWIKFGDK